MPVRLAVASGRFGVRRPRSTARARGRPSGLRVSARRPSSAWSTPSRRGDRIEHARRVERRDEREEAARSASANPATVPRGVARPGRRVTAKTVPLVPIETTTSPAAAHRGRGRRRRCRPCPAPTTIRPSGHRARSGPAPSPAAPGASTRQVGETAFLDCRGAERAGEQVAVVVAGRRVPVAGAARVGAVGRERVEVGAERRSPAGPKPRSRQVSQSWGSATAATRAAFSGSASRSQRSLVTVKEATGTMPVRWANVVGADLGDQVARRPGPSGCRSRAGRGG